MKLEDVARCARVSTATVSRVLNDSAGVKSSTRARVMAAMDELKYHPNFHARSLAVGTSRSIGLIVSNMENPFYLDIYKAIEGGAHRAGYEVLIANTGYSFERLAASVRLMLGHRVAGLAAIVSELDPEVIQELVGPRIPMVYYDGGALRRNIFNIHVNYPRGMEKLISYLHNLGHRHVGFVGHHVRLGPIQERVNLLQHAGSRFPGLRVETAEEADSLEGGRRAARALLTANPGITALVCVNDWMAVGALRELRERGLDVPGDISVTGFDNVNLAQYCFPSLTSLHIPRDRIGQAICSYLMSEPPHSQGELLIDPELVVRESTGPAATCRR